MSTTTITRWQPGTDVVLPPWEMSDPGRRVYERCGPYTAGDEDGGWVLAGFVDGLARGLLGQLDEVAGSDEDGTPGLVDLLDPDRAPQWALAWLGQLVGVRVDPDLQLDGADPAAVVEARRLIREAPYWTRGTLDYMKRATASLLVPGAEVRVRERFDPNNPSVDSEHHLQIAVRWSHLLPEWQVGEIGPPDTRDLADEAKRQILAAVPAGIKGHIRVSDDRDWQEVKDTNPTWAAVLAGNTDWADVLTP